MKKFKIFAVTLLFNVLGATCAVAQVPQTSYASNVTPVKAYISVDDVNVTASASHKTENGISDLMSLRLSIEMPYVGSDVKSVDFKLQVSQVNDESVEIFPVQGAVDYPNRDTTKLIFDLSTISDSESICALAQAALASDLH